MSALDRLALLVAIFALTFVRLHATAAGRSFTIDFKNDVFVKDGEPFRMMGGSLHYFRVPRAYWKDRLDKIRAAGLNTVATYVEWSSHEPEIGHISFEGELDVFHFIELAKEAGLLVNLRVGPYICAERDNGGLPPWLFAEKKNITLRTSDDVFQYHVKRWLDVFMPRVRPHLYANGGPIILVQVENEYGSYPLNDSRYLAWLRDLFAQHVGNDALLYTTDGASETYLSKGKIPQVYATVDFGPTDDVNASIWKQRYAEPHGPLVNSEFYPGWLTHWGEPIYVANNSRVAKALYDILRIPNASFNLYVFAGGTNFGFTSGANFNNVYDIQPSLTSYDYAAPLTEAGDTTWQYHNIREMIANMTGTRPIPVPAPSPKMAFGSIHLWRVLDMRALSARPPVKSEWPLSFEEIRNYYGFVLYETELPEWAAPFQQLRLEGLADRAVVFLDKERFATFCRTSQYYSEVLPSYARPKAKLSILVENIGRINYGTSVNDIKGIKTVTLQDRPLSNWTISGFPLQNASRIHELIERRLSRLLSVEGRTRARPTSTPRPRPRPTSRPTPRPTSRPRPATNSTQFVPGVYYATFILPADSPQVPYDTFLDPTGWGKGVAYLNDFNLGRYWPTVGPQITLYTPGVYFRPYPQVNTLSLIEIDQAPRAPLVKFVDSPVLNGKPALVVC